MGLDFSLTFVHMFLWGVFLVSPVLLMLFTAIISLGVVVGRLESWRRFDALYWAFITALTVGYGDIRPSRKISRVLSVVIACFGIMFAGILVSITVEATSSAFKKHVPPETIEHLSKDLWN